MLMQLNLQISLQAIPEISYLAITIIISIT